MCIRDSPDLALVGHVAQAQPPRLPDALQVGTGQDLGQLRLVVSGIRRRRKRDHPGGRVLRRCDAVGLVVGSTALVVGQGLVGVVNAAPQPLELRRVEERVGGQGVLTVHLQGEPVGALDLVAGGPGLESQDLVGILVPFVQQ